MIRISFDTKTNSEDLVAPEAWRSEAATLLKQIATRIENGDAMPLQLIDRAGKLIGKAREISYQPEQPNSSSQLRHAGFQDNGVSKTTGHKGRRRIKP